MSFGVLAARYRCCQPVKAPAFLFIAYGTTLPCRWFSLCTPMARISPRPSGAMPLTWSTVACRSDLASADPAASMSQLADGGSLCVFFKKLYR